MTPPHPTHPACLAHERTAGLRGQITETVRGVTRTPALPPSGCGVTWSELMPLHLVCGQQAGKCLFIPVSEAPRGGLPSASKAPRTAPLSSLGRRDPAAM